MKPPFSKREDAHGGNVPTIKIMNTEGMLEVEDSAAEAAAVAAECAEDLEAIPADDVPEDLREGLPFWAELNPLFDAVATDGAPLPSAPDGGGNRMWGVLGGSMQRFHQGECHTPVRVMGGKGKHINRLLRIVPEHRVYVEPFCGGASLFFAKKIAPVGSILNDNHGEIHNCLYQLKHHPAPLRRMLADGLNHERTYRLCRVVTENPDLFSPLQRAWAWLFACASSYMDHFNIEVDFSVSSNQTKFRRLNDRFNVSAAVVEKIRRRGHNEYRRAAGGVPLPPPPGRVPVHRSALPAGQEADRCRPLQGGFRLGCPGRFTAAAGRAGVPGQVAAHLLREPRGEGGAGGQPGLDVLPGGEHQQHVQGRQGPAALRALRGELRYRGAGERPEGQAGAVGPRGG